MTSTMVSLDYRKCRPHLCNDGFCTAAPACPLHMIEQEEKYDFPMIKAANCKGCAICVKACPLKALAIS